MHARGGEGDLPRVTDIRVFLGINRQAPGSMLLPDKFEEKIGELSGGFERLLVIEGQRACGVRFHPGGPQPQAKEEDR